MPAFTSLQKAVYVIVVMWVFTILMHAGGVPIEGTGKKLIDQFPRQTPGLTPSSFFKRLRVEVFAEGTSE